MSSHPLFGLYKRLPVWLQSQACWLYGYNFARRHYDSDYYEKLGHLLESETWSACEIEAYQDEQTRNLIKNAYHKVQYYNELMNGLKLRPSDIKTIKDLPKLPVLSKEQVRNNSEKFVSKDANTKRLISRHTSGTTGKSLHFYVNHETNKLQWATWWRHRNRFGMTNESWHVNFRAHLLVPADQEKIPLWRWVSPLRQVIINMQHITPSKIRHLVDFLNNHYFEFFTAYPSIVHNFASTASEEGLGLRRPPRVIFMGCENTMDFQKKSLEEFTGSIITDQYGFSEACGNASQCEYGMYHEDFELGVMEQVEPETEPNGRSKSKIVCTGLTCHEFPFIRYEVGDVGVWENPQVTCPCGRHSKGMIRLEGRQDDYVLTPEGARIMRFDYIFKDTKSVMESQIVQEKLGEIKIYIVRRSNYNINDEAFIRNEIKKWISASIRIRFDYVTEIERETNGKYRAVKSFLRIPASTDLSHNCLCSTN